MTDTTLRSPARGSRRRLSTAIAVLIILLVIAGAWFMKAVDPLSSRLLPPCVFYQFTGLYCAGCGSGRMLHLLLNGHVWAAFRMNPLAMVSLPVFAYLLARVGYSLYFKKPLPRLPAFLPWVCVAAILLFTVARNLPWMPLAWLAPTNIG